MEAGFLSQMIMTYLDNKLKSKSSNDCHLAMFVKGIWMKQIVLLKGPVTYLMKVMACMMGRVAMHSQQK